jgi:hypothetical protein
VLTDGGLAHAELFAEQDTAHAVVDEISVDLRTEVSGRLLEPLEDLEPAIVVDGSQRFEKR